MTEAPIKSSTDKSATDSMRSHYCGEIDAALIGGEISVCGWVNRRRDHGGVIFIDLRDREGLLQLVADPSNPQVFAVAEKVRNEFVLQAKGRLRARPPDSENPELKSGTVELLCESLLILNAAHTPPFQIDDFDVGDEIRLRYRYVDLRRPQMLANLKMRARILQTLRAFLDQHGFIEIETPILTRATPEGARDYLVPSRVQPHSFYALPQSPQLFKQLLMMGGVDRYYQTPRCFRDEDLRADRQPEFSQLDIEVSFMDEHAIMALIEQLLKHLYRCVLDIELPDFPRMRYADAMQRYGCDRPDLRIPLELCELSDLLREVEFKVFSAPANDANGRVAALRIPHGSRLSRKEIDDYTAYVARFGAKGLAYIKCAAIARGREGLHSPILKFLPDDVIAQIIGRSAAADGDLIFFGAGPKHIVNDSLSALRIKIAHDLGLVSKNPAWQPLWIVDFPMFEYNPQSKRWDSMHHPFTAPAADAALLSENPAACLSRAYDVVINGVELGGGSIRIHDPSTQRAVFKVLGLDPADAEEKFGFLLTALNYGCPPHGGIAFGLDRIAMLMSGSPSIRDVIAFPKTQSAACPLTAAPAAADSAQLKELHLRLGQ